MTPMRQQLMTSKSKICIENLSLAHVYRKQNVENR